METNSVPAVRLIQQDCFTFGGAVDGKSIKLNPTEQSTAAFRCRPMSDASNAMSGRLGGAQGMTKFDFYLLSSVCCLSVFQWLSV
jgi:hypothetical protein